MARTWLEPRMVASQADRAKHLQQSFGKKARSMLVRYGICFVGTIVGGALSFVSSNDWQPSGVFGTVSGLALVVLFNYFTILRTGIKELAVKPNA